MSPSRPLPAPPTLAKTLGPSFILLGLALGSGELILWPYLAARYGLGLLWGALLGISFQFVLNTEVMRYTLYRGESVFVGFSKLSRFLPLWFVISTALPWSIPGFSSASANIVHQILPGLPESWLAVGLLLFTGIMLSAGRSLYKTLELFQRTIIFIGLPIIIGLVLWMAKSADWLAAAQGMVGIGDGWQFFPPMVAVTAFLGAFAYAGAGGNLNLAQSFYIREKGFGMGRYMPKISSLFRGKVNAVELEGETFADNQINHGRWRAWWWLVNTEHALVFFGLGLLSIILLSVLAYSTVYGAAHEQLTEGLSFLYLQADVLAAETWPLMRGVFLILAALMLFATQVGVLESAARIISENLAIITHRENRKVKLSLWFYAALWTEILVGIIIYAAGIQEPRFLITLSAILNAAAMMVSFILIQILNRRALRSFYRPKQIRLASLTLASLFFLFFLTLTFFETF